MTDSAAWLTAAAQGLGLSGAPAAVDNTGFSLNPVVDWQELTRDAFMRNALLAGTVAAVVCGVVGYFVVLRGLAFATDALTHVGFAGASGAVLLGVSPVAGLLALTGATALGIGAFEERLRGRDVVIGMVLVEALGLGVLFLRLSSGYSNQTFALLFGNILALDSRDLVVMAVSGAVAVGAMVAVFRPLLFASLDAEVAQARGVPVRRLAVGFLVILALAVTAATQVIGALLAVALVIAPAASAQRVSSRPGIAILLSVVLALAVTWLGIAIAFWQPYPVSFFITALAALIFAGSRAIPATRASGHASRAPEPNLGRAA